MNIMFFKSILKSQFKEPMDYIKLKEYKLKQKLDGGDDPVEDGPEKPTKPPGEGG